MIDIQRNDQPFARELLRGQLAPVGATPVGVGSARGRSCMGSDRARQHRPPTRCRPRATVPATGATAHADGVQHRRLRRAVTAMAQWAKEGLGHPLVKRMMLPP
ncbi:hypothetical protein GW17_00017980 [Ensete ventricosum]|nr:hypothetical protein GW17_00017980 [Ensete ventricosum]